VLTSFNWFRKGPVTIGCEEKYAITKVVNSVGKVKYISWPPPPPSLPKYSFYNWNDYLLNSIGMFDTAEEAKSSCLTHYSEAQHGNKRA